jgi:hypothetical protein
MSVKEILYHLAGLPSPAEADVALARGETVEIRMSLLDRLVMPWAFRFWAWRDGLTLTKYPDGSMKLEGPSKR